MTQRRVVVDVSGAPQRAATAPREVEEVAFIGETAKNVYGYSLAVKSVRLDRRGLRVRIESMRDGAATYHMDITTELAAWVLPLLQQAAELGGPVQALRNDEWWTTCSVRELRDRATGMTLKDLEMLAGKLNDASMLAHQAVELSGRAAQDLARAAIVRAKRQAVKRILTGMIDEKAKHNATAYGTSGHKSRRLVSQIMAVFRERLGNEVAEAVFFEAKRRVAENTTERGDEQGES